MKSRKGYFGGHEEKPDPENNKSLDWGAGEPDPSTPEAEWTEEQADALQMYIWTIRDMFGLRHWDVYLAAQYCEEGAQASVHPLYGRHVAAIYINKNWFTYPREDQRNAMVHEILHIVHNEQTDVVRVGYSSAASSAKVGNAFWALFERETEMMVDHLANCLSDMFPMMPELKASDGQ